MFLVHSQEDILILYIMMRGVLPPSLLSIIVTITCCLLLIYKIHLVVLLHKISEIYDVFVHFKATVENQLSTSTEVLRTDCGGQYTKHEIFHIFLIPWHNSPGQTHHNKIGKLKGSIDTLLRLQLLYCLWPLSSCHWSNVVSTSVFLINRIPNSVHNFISARQKLHLPDFTNAQPSKWPLTADA